MAAPATLFDKIELPRNFADPSPTSSEPANARKSPPSTGLPCECEPISDVPQPGRWETKFRGQRQTHSKREPPPTETEN